LQPLYIGVFRPFSQAYTQILDRHNRWDGKWINKALFIEYYVEARKEAISSANVCGAFKTTGINPYMPSITLEKLSSHTSRSEGIAAKL
jgi:hypothetical protein